MFVPNIVYEFLFTYRAAVDYSFTSLGIEAGLYSHKVSW